MFENSIYSKFSVFIISIAKKGFLPEVLVKGRTVKAL